MRVKGLVTLLSLLLILPAGLQAQFARTYGGTANDVPNRILAASDGGFVVAGTSGVYLAGTWLLKLDGDGAFSWHKTYRLNIGTPSLCATADGGYLLAGNSDFGVRLVKTNGSGDPEWQQYIPNYGGYTDSYVYSLVRAADSGFFLVGTTTAADHVSVWVAKVSAEGSFVWQKAYALTSYEYGLSAEATGDGGCVIAGRTSLTDNPSFGGNHRPLLFRIDALGTVLWQTVLNITGYDNFVIDSIRGTDEDGYVLTGSMWSGTLDPVGFAGRIGADGTLAWARSFGRGLRDGRPIEGGGSIVVGTAGASGTSDILVAKLLENGDVEWSKRFGGSLREEGRAIVETASGDHAVAGMTTSFGAGAMDVCVLRLSLEGGLGACGFSKSAGVTAETADIAPSFISLSVKDTNLAAVATDVEMADADALTANYRLCAAKKLLTICADASVTSSATSPALGTHLYDAGASVTITAAKTSGNCTFTGWGGDAGGNANAITVIVDDDMTVQAKYACSGGGTDEWGEGGGGLPSGGGCFVATAAFGSPLHPAVRLLRKFRDKRLLTNGAGRAFVAAYYRSSPAVARAIEGYPPLRTAVQLLLLPIIAIVIMVLKLGWVPTLLLVAAATALASRSVSSKAGRLLLMTTGAERPGRRT